MSLQNIENILDLTDLRTSDVKAIHQERLGNDDIEIEMSDKEVHEAIELCDQFFDWILNLTTIEQLQTICFDDDKPEYPSMDVEVTLFDPDKTTNWLNLYISGKTFDEIEVMAHTDMRIVILGVVEAIWKEENKRRPPLERLLQAAEVDSSMVMAFRNFVSSGASNENKTPFRLFQKLFVTPLTAAVGLLLVRADLAKWSMNIDWAAVVLPQFSPNEYMKALETLDRNLVQHFSTDVRIGSQEIEADLGDLADQSKAFDASLKMIQHDYDCLKKDAEFMVNDIRNLRQEMETLSAGRKIQITDELWPKGLSRSPPRNREENDEIDAEIAALSREKENIHVPTPATMKLNDLVNLSIGISVLARREPNDNELFEPGSIIAIKEPASKYVVKFNSDCMTKIISVEDLAYALLQTAEDFIEGMRVCALVRHPNPPKHLQYRAHGYFSGVISNRPTSTHNYEYLVFFDDNFDEYVPRDSIKVMAVQPLDRGIIDKRKASTLIRNSDKKRRFVHLYFNSYPDWGLVRLRKSDAQQNNRIAVRHRDGPQWSAIVMDVDRHMCLLRFPPLGRNLGIGATCVVRNCSTHYHMDERLYRGSDRFHQVEQSIKQHEADPSLLSNMAPGRQRHQKTMLESAVPLYTDDRPRQNDRKSRNSNVVRKTTTPSGMIPAIPRPHANLGKFTSEQINERKKNMNRYELVTLYNEDSATPTISGYHAECNIDCLRNLNKDPSTYKGLSPFHIPLLCGWQRLIYNPTHSSTTRRSRRSAIVYRGPCGRPLLTMDQISDYLRSTMCELTIDYFSMDLSLRTNVVVKVDARYQVLADFTQGLEAMPITVVNTVDNGPLPDIQYSAKRFPESDEVDVSSARKEFCAGCTCTDDCRDPTKCECQLLTKSCVERLARDFRPSEKCRGYQYRGINERISSGIYECNDACSCWRKRCLNRVAQQPIKVPLQLFQTAQCGWGVRTLVDLPAGYFIANYNGALLTDHLADRLKERGDEYYAELDLIDSIESQKIGGGIDLLEDKGMADLELDSDTEPSGRSTDSDGYCSGDSGTKAKKVKKIKLQANEPEPTSSQQSQPAGFGENWDMEKYFGDKFLFIVDAKKRGNIGRFLNHSCAPNVFVQHVFVDTHDLRLPWISFFSSRAIKAGEELRWDYNYTFDETSQPVRVLCHCETKECRRRLL